MNAINRFAIVFSFIYESINSWLWHVWCSQIIGWLQGTLARSILILIGGALVSDFLNCIHYAIQRSGTAT